MGVVGWGETKHGQLGMRPGEVQLVETPQLIKSLHRKDVMDIGCGESHTIIVLMGGTVYSCGANGNGQLGHDGTSGLPERITAVEKFVITQVSCGKAHNVAITEQGEVLSWGLDDKGQCGFDHGDTSERKKPRILKSLSSHYVVQVACGYRHSVALTRDGRLFTWGDNSCGQLGIGASPPYSNGPIELNSLEGLPMIQVASGGFHSLALTRSGTMFGWGQNNFGQLGIGAIDSVEPFPKLLKTMRTQGVQYMSCGMHHSVMLTVKGSVFTCGLGANGRLGHGSYTNELNPRKVIDLAGKAVTQISCARASTYAYDSLSGSLFSFGAGSLGQLGGQPLCNTQPGPHVVAANWVQYPRGPCQANIYAIYSGGNHSLCVISEGENAVAPLDYRSFPLKKQTSFIDEEFITRVVNSAFDEGVRRKIKDLFSSASCLNSSFLKKDNAHFGSSRQNHGVDLDLARGVFSHLHTARAKEHFICICKVMEENLFPSLPESPLDIEALRLYLLLVEFSSNDESQVPFPVKTLAMLARSFGGLADPASKDIAMWWSTFQPRHLEKVVHVYQQCLVENLKRGPNYDPPTLIDVTRVLKKLNTVNNENHEIIPFNIFYIPHLDNLVDLKQHFKIWFWNRRVFPEEKFGADHPHSFTICDYPFVFDLQTKGQLLHMEALLKIKLAVHKVQQLNLIELIELIMDPQQVPFLVLNIQRNQLVESTIRGLLNLSPEEYKKPLKIVFEGEDARDDGGLRKEFFMLIMKEILDPKYGMFEVFEESGFVWFNKTFEDERMFYLVGVLCGLAIFNYTIIFMPFPPVLYKKILDRPTSFDDFRQMEPTIAKNLQHLLDYEGDDFEDDFCLSFDHSEKVHGANKTTELIPGGSDIPVTKDSKAKYVECYIDLMINKSVEKQFGQFKDGFLQVCGGQVLKFCHPDELMALVVGEDTYDWEEFQKSAVYQGELYANHQTIHIFWKVFGEFGLVLKKKFLVFLTGTDRIPIEGIKSLQPIFQPVKTGPEYYPVAHTCSNLLDLPLYDNEDSLREKLLTAIAHANSGFTIV